jgi:xanthine dehydrogenase accessory factor
MNAIDPIFAPLQFICAGTHACVLAIITETSGPGFRRAGAMMAIAANGEVSGSLSSGCIEADIAQQAGIVLANGLPKTARYGAGSPFIDLRLPCGGAIEVLLIPRPDRSVLRAALAGIDRRVPQAIDVRKADGAMTLRETTLRESPSIQNCADIFRLNLEPKLAFRIFGGGAETLHFAALAASLDFDLSVYTPETDVAARLAAQGISAVLLKSPDIPLVAQIDKWTAAILFFHDHDWEPPILHRLLASDAFYIGAQGSYLARLARDEVLAQSGVSIAQIARIKGPIGLIPATRDPRSLAVSVLAEILALAQAGGA